MINKLIKILLITGSLFTGIQAFADGAGGLEFMNSFSLEGNGYLQEAAQKMGLGNLPSNSLSAISGYGYGVGKDGIKAGGFGMLIWNNESLEASEFHLGSGYVNSFSAAYGGIITGLQLSPGPFLLALNGRLGIGGVSVLVQDTKLQTDYLYNSGSWYGACSILAGADVEAGIILGDSMALSLFAGFTGTANFGGSSPLYVSSPSYGLRLSWGSFSSDSQASEKQKERERIEKEKREKEQKEREKKERERREKEEAEKKAQNSETENADPDIYIKIWLF